MHAERQFVPVTFTKVGGGGGGCQQKGGGGCPNDKTVFDGQLHQTMPDRVYMKIILEWKRKSLSGGTLHPSQTSQK